MFGSVSQGKGAGKRSKSTLQKCLAITVHSTNAALHAQSIIVQRRGSEMRFDSATHVQITKWQEKIIYFVLHTHTHLHTQEQPERACMHTRGQTH